MPADLKTLEIRARLRSDALLSVLEATLVLPGTNEGAAKWLADQPPWGRVGGEPVYRWQDLVAAMGSKASATRSVGVSDAARRLGVSRGCLDAAVREAPADLPGAPFALGAGRSRKHRRWESASLETWWSAYRSWKAAELSKPAAAAPRRSRGAPVEGGPVDWRKAGSGLK